jgi:hypothetical protein
LDGVTSTATELNILDGVTSSTAELNILDGVTSTTAELNILDGVTATATELNVLDGVTAFLDEDDFASNSATAIPSQQSVKAYVTSSVTAAGGLSNVVEDTTPQLGGSLDVNGQDIVSVSNGNITLTPNGSGLVRLDGNVDIQSGEIVLKNSGSVSNIKLYCEVSNAHYTQLQSAAHSAYSGNVTVTLPAATDTLVGKATTDTLTNKTLTSPKINEDVAVTSTATELNILDGVTATTAELNYVDGVTSAIQTQLDAKAPVASPTFTGTVTIPTADINGGNIDGTTIGGSSAAAGTFTTLTATAASTITTADNNPQLTLISTDADASEGPVLKLYRNSGSPADNDILGRIQFSGEDDAGNDSTFGRIDVVATDVSNNSEDARMEFSPVVGDAFTPTMSLVGGDVGIGTTSPSHTLDVTGGNTDVSLRVGPTGSSGDNDGTLVINNGGTGDAMIRFDYEGNTDRARIGVSASGQQLEFYTAGAEEMRLESDGDLHVDGDVVAYSTTVSDERLKDDVQDITGALDTVDALRGVTYTWNAGSRKGKRDYGVIAQEVEQVIPEIVHDTTMPLLGDEETVYKTVDYEKLCAVLINAVSELRAEVEALKNGTSV